MRKKRVLTSRFEVQFSPQELELGEEQIQRKVTESKETPNTKKVTAGW